MQSFTPIGHDPASNRYYIDRNKSGEADGNPVVVTQKAGKWQPATELGPTDRFDMSERLGAWSDQPEFGDTKGLGAAERLFRRVLNLPTAPPDGIAQDSEVETFEPHIEVAGQRNPSSHAGRTYETLYAGAEIVQTEAGLLLHEVGGQRYVGRSEAQSTEPRQQAVRQAHRSDGAWQINQ